MDWLNITTEKVKQKLYNIIFNHWADLLSIAQPNLTEVLTPELIIPVSSCKAVGGNPDDAVEVATGLMSVMMSARILDDLQDKDKPNGLYRIVGPARAFNYSYAFMTLGYKIFTEMNCDELLKRKILDTFNEGSLITLAGQDRDLQGINTNWNDYWKTAEMKTCYITSTGAAMGAMVGTSNVKMIEACRLYGYHWGLTLQILNDLEGIWEAEGETDLDKGKVTLPLLYALHCQHKEREELETILWQGKIADSAARVKEILDHVDAKSYLIWAALEQRKKALEAIEICPDEEGKTSMVYFLNGMFGDIDDLLNAHQQIQHNVSFSEFHSQNRTMKELLSEDANIKYQSTALGLRYKFRANYN